MAVPVNSLFSESQRIDEIPEMRLLLDQMHGQQDHASKQTSELSQQMREWVQTGKAEITHIYYDSEVVHIFDFRASPDCVYGNHRHPDSAELMLVVSGHMILTDERGDTEYHEGEFCVIPPNTTHTAGFRKESIIRVVLLPPDSAYAPENL